MNILEKPNPGSQNVFIIAPGAGGGTRTPFITDLVTTLRPHGSVITFDYGFFTQNSQPSPGFTAELEDLWTVYQHAQKTYPDHRVL